MWACMSTRSSLEESELQVEKEWMQQLKAKNIPVILILNKTDIRKNIPSIIEEIERILLQKPVAVSAKDKKGLEDIRLAILEKLPQDFASLLMTKNYSLLK